MTNMTEWSNNYSKQNGKWPVAMNQENECNYSYEFYPSDGGLCVGEVSAENKEDAEKAFCKETGFTLEHVAFFGPARTKRQAPIS